MNRRVVIIGVGFGGLEAAFSLRELLPSARARGYRERVLSAA